MLLCVKRKCSQFDGRKMTTGQKKKVFDSINCLFVFFYMCDTGQKRDQNK